MNILILGLNYAPEPVGIGPYTEGMATALAAASHDVTVVCGKAYYPQWRADPRFAGGGVRHSTEQGVRVLRLPIYVPARPNGWRRLAHHFTFAVRAVPSLLTQARQRRPDVVICVAPSLISMIAARLVARLFGARAWLHIQDFEVEAAFATGLLRPRGLLARAARGYEAWSLKSGRISTISPQMCDRLRMLGIDPGRIVEFRNWADIDGIRPLTGESPLRQAWGIDRPLVALYSGNIANKQGIQIVVEAARLLAARRDLLFIICGNGPNRAALAEQARDLDNILFVDLQPVELLSDLLGLATLHLLPQIAAAADLVLPSKLANMLASGRPIVATAAANTGIAQEVADCGVISPPGDAAAFADAIARLLDDPGSRVALGAAARRRAESRWDRRAVLHDFQTELMKFSTQQAI